MKAAAESAPPAWALPGEQRINIRTDQGLAYRRICEARDAWPEGWQDRWLEPQGVWRADVFAVADRWRQREMPARQLLGAVCVWGHGSNGYGPRRTEWTLDTHDLDARLARALDPLREELLDLDVILSSYKALRAPEASRLRWFRASFFTKLLYFAGYRRGVGGVQPLILDSVVASRLDLPGVTKPRRHFYPNWRSEEWRIYIEWAARQTAGGEPENIEIELFNRGSARP